VDLREAQCIIIPGASIQMTIYCHVSSKHSYKYMTVP